MGPEPTAELRRAEALPSAEDRRQLRGALGAVVPGWQPLAENVLGEGERIDWVGRDREGRAVLVLVGGAGDDLALVARGLAQLDWVSARLADWAQLSRDAGLRADADAVVLLLAPRFRPAALAAARAAGAAALRLAELRFAEVGPGEPALPLLELVWEGGAVAAANGGALPSFRSGLSAAELDLTPEERAEFEGPERLS